MPQPTQNLSPPLRQKRKAAIVGGGRLALETFALLAKDPDLEVVCLWDPDRTALMFRLKELGFSFADHLKPKLLSDLRELTAVTALDFIIDTSSNSQIRRSLDSFLDQGTRILSGEAAQILWGLRLSQDMNLDRTLDRLKALVENIDLVHDAAEFFEILLQTNILFTRAQGAALYLIRPEEQETCMVYSVAQHSRYSAGGLNHTPKQPFNFNLVQKAVKQKKPVLTAQEGHPVSTGQISSNGFDETPTLVLPLIADGTALGVIELYKESSAGPFVPQDLEACSRLCSVGIKLLKKILNLQEMRELSITETVRTEIKGILNGQFSLQEKLAKGVEKIREILGCHCHFYVKERFSNDFVLQASSTQAYQVCGMLRIRAGEGFVGEVARSKQPVFLKGEVSGSPSGQQQALLCLPLSTPTGLWGVLYAERLFMGIGAKKSIKLLEEIAETFAQVIAGDLEHHRMSQKLLRLSVVQEEGLEILSVTDRDKLAAMITASAAMLVDAEAVILRVFEKKGKRLLVGSTYGLHRNEMDTRLVELDGIIALKVFQECVPQALEDLRRIDPGLPEKFPYRYAVCRPVVYEGSVVGTLSIYNKLSFQSFGCTAFDQDDTELLEKFSYYAGKALINLQETQARSALITIDELTGLRNERYLMMRLPEEIRRAERYKRSLALMVFEVKSEAETQPAPGSSAEKEFIKQVAEVLQEKFRNVDIVVRVKGARFAILMPDTGETVTDAVTRLSRGLAILPLRIFIGYGTYPSDAKSAQALMTKASKLSEMVREP
jgi:diguanylate cyclase (GGDEF)-like protein